MGSLEGAADRLELSIGDSHRPVTVQAVTGEQEFRALSAEWTSLLQQSRANTIFLTWEWITTWWTVYGRPGRLNILTARIGDALVGVAPLQRTRRGLPGLPGAWAVEFIGQGGDVTPEYLDFFVLPGLEDRVVDAFLDHLLADATIEVLDLQSLRETSPTLPRLEERLGHDRAHFRKQEDAVCPVLDLPGTVDAFLASRSRNYLRKMGEYERRCQRDLRVRLRQCATVEELRTDMSALISLHHQRWAGASRAFRSHEYVAFHEALAASLLDRGWLRLFSLDSGTDRLALLYCFAYNGCYYYYQAGRNPAHNGHRLGLVLMHRAIQEAIRESATTFDFLRGDEAYKNRWAKRTVKSVRIMYCKHMRARAITSLASLALWTRRLQAHVRYRIKTGVAGMLAAALGATDT